MNHSTTLISEVIRDRMERGLADLLLSAYDAGYSAGAGMECEAATHPGLRELLGTLAMRHQAEVLALRQWADPPLLRDEIPGWLLAETERQVALGDAMPPDGWHAVALGGKP